MSDLQKSDFTVTEDGKAQTISVFLRESGVPNALPVGLPPGIFSNRPDESAAPPRITVILLDSLNTEWPRQATARQKLARFLSQIQPQDRVALYTLGRTLRVVHDYTNDAGSLLNLIKTLRGETVAEVTSEEAVKTLIPEVDEAAAKSSVREADFQMGQRIAVTLKALEEIGHHLAGVPGRKNLIWVSGGFPLSVGFDQILKPSGVVRDQRVFTPELNRTLRTLGNASVAVYPIDARGLLGPPEFDAANRVVLAPSAQGPGIENTAVMRELASRTGGRAFYDRNDLDTAMLKVFEESRMSYIIGYYSANDSFDGRFRQIKVRVDRPGVAVRHRQGYFASSEPVLNERQKKADVQQAVYSPLDASAVSIAAKIGPGQGSGNVALALQVDVSSLFEKLGDDRYALHADVVFIQKDKKGEQLERVIDAVSMVLRKESAARLAREGFVYQKKVQVRPNASSIRVIVRENSTGALGSLTIPLEVAAAR